MRNLWARQQQPLVRVAVLAVSVVLAGLLAYRQVDRWRGKIVTVWVAAADIEAGTRIAAQELTPTQQRDRAVSADTVLKLDAIEGMNLVRPKAAGQSFVKGDLSRPPRQRGPGLSGVVPEGRVLMSIRLRGFPIADLADQLRRGDHLDIFSIGPPRPLHMGRDAIFLGWIRPEDDESNGNGNGDGNGGGVGGGLVDAITRATESAMAAPPRGPAGPSPVLLGVRPQDVRRLAWVESARVRVSVVLHGRNEVEKDELVLFPYDPPGNEMEVILGPRRATVSFAKPP